MAMHGVEGRHVLAGLSALAVLDLVLVDLVEVGFVVLAARVDAYGIFDLLIEYANRAAAGRLPWQLLLIVGDGAHLHRHLRRKRLEVVLVVAFKLRLWQFEARP